MTGCTCVIDVDVDEYPDHFWMTTPKAHKEHKCCECNRTIRAGEKYEKAVLLQEGGFTKYVTCSTCSEIRSCFFCSYYYTQIWEDMREYFEFDEIKICALDKLSPAARDVMIDWIDGLIAEDDE